MSIIRVNRVTFDFTLALNVGNCKICNHCRRFIRSPSTSFSYEQRVVRVLYDKNHNFHASVYHEASNNRAHVNQLPSCPHVRVMQSLFPWSVYLGRASENTLLTICHRAV